MLSHLFFFCSNKHTVSKTAQKKTPDLSWCQAQKSVLMSMVVRVAKQKIMVVDGVQPYLDDRFDIHWEKIQG
jgi:uncharacterized sodium:solute symporter family permease YidK